MLTLSMLLSAAVSALVPGAPAAAAAPSSTKFVAVAPQRILDTRTGLGVLHGLASPGTPMEVQVAGRGGVPGSSVTAVALSVVVADAPRVGYLQAVPTGSSALGGSSNVNIDRPGQTASNFVTVPLGAGGRISLHDVTGGALIVDVVGYFTPAAASRDGRLLPVAPVRVLDSRDGTGLAPVPGPGGAEVVPARPVGAGQTVRIDVGTVAGVPATGVSSVAVTVTGTGSDGPGFIQVLPASPGPERGTTSNVNLPGRGSTAASLAVAPVGPDGAVHLYTSVATHLVVDVVGYVTDGSAPSSSAGLFVPLHPTRVTDTRAAAAVPGGSATVLAPLGRAGIPTGGVGAVLVNATVTGTRGPGYLTVFPTGWSRPTATSSLNYTGPAQTLAGAAIGALGERSTTSIHTSTTTHLVLDVQGYFTGDGGGDTPVPAPAGAPEASVWSTSADAGHRMRHLGQVVATAPSAAAGAEVIGVGPDASGQSVVGFGAALTHSSARLVAALPADQRRRLLAELFDPAGPVRLSVLRIPLGASDFVATRAFTYDDVPPGETDWDLARFTTAGDRELRSVLREIRTIAPDLLVVASPWSAPAWLKSSGSLYGGRLLPSPRAHRAYADYLVRAVQEHAADGVRIDVLTVQNEPQTRTWADYPRMEMPVADQVSVVGALGPALRAAGLRTRILGYDHNWAQHPADVAATPAGADPEHAYPTEVLASPAGPWLSGTAFHCYYGDASAQEPVHAAFPDKEIWVTECSGSHGPGDAPAKVFADTLYWHSRNVLLPSLRHWASTVVMWNLALDASGGPHVGGCDTCTGVVTVQDGVVTRNAEYYLLAHAARFVPRGAVRVPTTAAPGSPLVHVAFRAPDGSVTVLAHNAGPTAREVPVLVDGRSYRVSFPAWSLTTVVLAAPVGGAAASRP